MFTEFVSVDPIVRLVEAAGIEAGALALHLPVILAFVERAKPARIVRALLLPAFCG